MKLKYMDKAQEAWVADVISGKVPFDIPDKEKKLHMRNLKSLTEELEQLTEAFSRRSVPRDVRNRINRLEKVIAYKTTVIQEALNERAGIDIKVNTTPPVSTVTQEALNESGRTGEES